MKKSFVFVVPLVFFLILMSASSEAFYLYYFGVEGNNVAWGYGFGQMIIGGIVGIACGIFGSRALLELTKKSSPTN